jgi:hypothetical protein
VCITSTPWNRNALSNDDLKRIANETVWDLHGFDDCWQWPDRSEGIEPGINRYYQQAFTYQFMGVQDIINVLASRIPDRKAPAPNVGPAELWGKGYKTATSRADLIEKLASQIPADSTPHGVSAK